MGVETARGIINLREIASADPRLQGIIFGAEDFAGDIGATRTPQGWEVFYARSAVVTFAAAYGLQAIDMVQIDFKDAERLYQEALEGARMAFAGKQVIHPSQIEPVQRAFTPTDEAIAHAQRVVQAFERAPGAWSGRLCAGWANDRCTHCEGCRTGAGFSPGGRKSKVKEECDANCICDFRGSIQIRQSPPR